MIDGKFIPTQTLSWTLVLRRDSNFYKILKDIYSIPH